MYGTYPNGKVRKPNSKYKAEYLESFLKTCITVFSKLQIKLDSYASSCVERALSSLSPLNHSDIEMTEDKALSMFLCTFLYKNGIGIVDRN